MPCRQGLLLLLVGVTGCIGNRTEAGPNTPTLGSPVITGEELADLSVSTAWDVVERLRPLWLRSAGPRARSARLVSEIVVVTDGQFFGTLSSLRQIPADGIREIRHLVGAEATNAFPLLASGRHVEAAIVISMGGPRRHQSSAEEP